MKALTSETLNLIIFDLNSKFLKDFKIVDLKIKVQTTYNENENLSGVRLIWKIMGLDKTQKKIAFNYVVENTFDVKENHTISFDATKFLVYKSYEKVVTEFDAQMISKASGTIRMPFKLEDNIIQQVQNAIQKPKK